MLKKGTAGFLETESPLEEFQIRVLNNNDAREMSQMIPANPWAI